MATCGENGGLTSDGDPCRRSAGWGTEYDSGKCVYHRDDICGEETSDGSPCQISPPETCPHHNNQSSQSNAGRSHKLDDQERRDRVIAAAKNGTSKSGCARNAGVTLETLNSYLEDCKQSDNPEKIEFFDRFKQARAQGEQSLIKSAKTNGDAKFLLSTSYGYTKKQELEHSTAEDEPLEVKMSHERLAEAHELLARGKEEARADETGD